MSYSNLPEGYTNAIGELVVSISALDSVLIDLLAIASDMHILNAVVAFSHLQTTSKIDTLKALYSLMPGGEEKEEKDRLTELMNQARDLCAYRNSVVHAYWSIGDDGIVSSVRFSARGKFKRQKHPTDAQEILLKAHEIFALEETLRGLRDHILSANEGDEPHHPHQ